MSIYGSLEAPCDDQDCTPPLVYQGSHVLPSDDDERGGHVDLALIPSHITRDGRDDQPEDEAPYPWLRFGVNEGVCVLDKAQVKGIRDTLDWWLGAVEGTRKIGDPIG